jgi:hypothetical protein
MLGCGGPRAADVSGKVTFNGQPIPAGMIYFNPDFTKSNDGAQGFADIHNGEFDTRKKGKGACGGPTIVSIEGFDGEGGGKPGALGNRLFVPFEVKVDLPKTDCKQDFDVPASAADNLVKRPHAGKGP